MIGILSEEQLEEVLRRNVLGRIGCNDGRRNYVVPINYVYHDGFVIAHSVMGMKIEMMRKNPSVCFEVDEMTNFNNWKSVIAWGEYQELKDHRARFSAMRLFVDKLMHIKISETARSPEIEEGIIKLHSHMEKKPIIYRIVITEKTGRYENER